MTRGRDLQGAGRSPAPRRHQPGRAVPPPPNTWPHLTASGSRAGGVERSPGDGRRPQPGIPWPRGPGSARTLRPTRSWRSAGRPGRADRHDGLDAANLGAVAAPRPAGRRQTGRAALGALVAELRPACRRWSRSSPPGCGARKRGDPRRLPSLPLPELCRGLPGAGLQLHRWIVEGVVVNSAEPGHQRNGRGLSHVGRS